jgi:hypothetical protein
MSLLPPSHRRRDTALRTENLCATYELENNSLKLTFDAGQSMIESSVIYLFAEKTVRLR